MSEGRPDPRPTAHEHSRNIAQVHQASRAEYDDAKHELSLLDLLVVVAGKLRLMIGPLLARLAALGIGLLIAPAFTARTFFLPPEEQQSVAAAALSQLGPLAGAPALAIGFKNPADQCVSLPKSVTVTDGLIERFELVALYEAEFRQSARTTLGGNTKVAAGMDGLIVVVVDDISPRRAADIATGYVNALDGFRRSIALTESQQLRVFFEKQLEQTKVRQTKELKDWAQIFYQFALGVAAIGVLKDSRWLRTTEIRVRPVVNILT